MYLNLYKSTRCYPDRDSDPDRDPDWDPSVPTAALRIAQQL